MKSLLLISLLLAGCTVAPKAVESHHASIGLSGKADSGIVAFTPAGYEIDAKARDRYNALMSLYGKDPIFVPPLVPDQGITRTGDKILLDRDGMRRFLLLNEWRQMGRIPPKKPLLQRLLRADPPTPRPLPEPQPGDLVWI